MRGAGRLDDVRVDSCLREHWALQIHLRFTLNTSMHSQADDFSRLLGIGRAAQRA